MKKSRSTLISWVRPTGLKSQHMGRGILALMVMFSAWQVPAMAEGEHDGGHGSINPEKLPKAVVTHDEGHGGHGEHGNHGTLNPAKMPEAVTIHVPLLTAAPTMDGQLSEWTGIGGKTVSVPIQPTLESDPANHTGNLVVELTTGVFGDRFYVAARWPDKAPDTSFQPWRWRGDSYDQEKKQLDDIFALRFQLSGDYDDCMLSKKDYRSDVWTWTAGRSMAAGLAEDRFHIISQKPLENAADFSSPHGTIYIVDRPDAGDPIYTRIEQPPKGKQGEKIPSIALTGKASGSVQDVTARGEWKDGFWNLEMSRLLNTGHDDDALLGQGATIAAATAVFNHSTKEHKSVSGTLNLVFPP